MYRAGIAAVIRWEAAGALGLSRWRTMRLVVLPQAIRIVIPPGWELLRFAVQRHRPGLDDLDCELMFTGQLIASDSFKYTADLLRRVCHLRPDQRPR